MSKTDNIKVYIRFKPLLFLSESTFNEQIRNRESQPIHYQIRDNKKELEILPQKISKQSIPKNNSIFRSLNFTYDQIFPYNTTQFEVFECAIIPILESVMEGYNSTIVCYGQTGSGKTYTMMGMNNDYAITNIEAKATDLNVNSTCGIIPRVFQYFFDEINNSPVTSQYTIAISYFEIYNEEIKDLLNLSKDSKIIHIREKVSDIDGEVLIDVDGLDKVYVGNMNNVNEILKIGNSNRQVAETKMNSFSSRSHCILRIEITSSEEDNPLELRNSSLFLVDLAGSERINKLGKQTSSSSLKETIGINSSLSVFSNVINILGSEDTTNFSKYIPYRDSKLTRVLQNSIGGSSKTAMIINCSSEIEDLSETISSLRFAQRAKHVQNKIAKNPRKTDKQGECEIETYNNNKNTSSGNERDNEEISKNWKSKYINSLKKIIELETKVEINAHESNTSAKPKDFDNNNYATTSTIRRIESLESDIEIYRKLLVSKTDQILQLESELENYQVDKNDEDSNLNTNHIEQDSFNVMKEMTDTIQLQNSELLQQVERAELLVKHRENQLKNANLKWSERNELVINQQNEVENKLIEMSRRLKNITTPELGKDDNFIVNLSMASDISKNTSNWSRSSENSNHGVKKGLNLHIIKPS